MYGFCIDFCYIYSIVGSFTLAARIEESVLIALTHLFNRHQLKTNKILPRVIAMDEFKGGIRGERFQPIVAEVENKEIIDVLLDRKVDTIKNIYSPVILEM